MSDEREIRPGFLPPVPPGGQPPRLGTAPEAPAPAPPPPQPQPPGRPTFVTGVPAGPSSPLAVASIVISVFGGFLLLLTLGLGAPFSGILGGIALALAFAARSVHRQTGKGRESQIRTARALALGLLVLSLLAAIAWVALESSGFSPTDLEQWLEEELERRRREGGDDGGLESPAEPA